MSISSVAARADINNLLQGRPPVSDKTLQRLNAGTEDFLDFLDQHYLRSYIPDGGSKIKFISGRSGSGKTHFARMLEIMAKEKGYITVSFSAESVGLFDFRDFYLEILRQCRIEKILARCADNIVRKLGNDPDEIPEGMNYLDYLSERGESDALSRSAIRAELRSSFTKNPLLENSFASCCSLLTGDILGHPVLESAKRELIISYLYGDKEVKLSLMRSLGLSPSRITKYNARYLLRSLTELIRLAGYKGLLVVVDDLEVLMGRSSDSQVRYTKVRREDAYENIRQLIDEIDSMHSVLFLFCCERELFDNDSYGVKTYQALWMRIQSEIVSTRFNRFADKIDLDRFADDFYSPEVLCRMGDLLSAFVDEREGIFEGPDDNAGSDANEGAGPQYLQPDPEAAEKKSAKSFDEDTARQLIERSAYGGVGLPYMVNRAVLEGDLH